MPVHQLCHIDEIPDNQAKGFTIGDSQVFAVKQWGNIYVYLNSCPHLSLPLEWMPDQFLDSDGQYIQCATHGALFKINTGECISGPCLGDHLQSLLWKIEDSYLKVEI